VPRPGLVRRHQEASLRARVVEELLRPREGRRRHRRDAAGRAHREPRRRALLPGRGGEAPAPDDACHDGFGAPRPLQAFHAPGRARRGEDTRTPEKRRLAPLLAIVVAVGAYALWPSSPASSPSPERPPSPDGEDASAARRPRREKTIDPSEIREWKD